MDVRAVLSQLRALEHWVEEATSVHMRPYVLKEMFERDADAVMRAAEGHGLLLVRVHVRLMRLRVRLQRPGQDAGADTPLR